MTFGSQVKLNSFAYIHLTELAKNYGSVFSFKCGQFDVVVINEVKAIEEAFKNELACPNTSFIPEFEPSFLDMSGEPWRLQRRVALTILRNVGLGKSTLEGKIKEEIGFFIESIKSTHGAKVDFNEFIGLSVANNVSILMFGHRFEYNDPIAIEMIHNTKQVSENIEYFNKFLFMPSITSLVSLAARFSSDYNKTNGTKVVKSQNFMTFSGGKRICPGATLALIELFFYLVSIVQNFRVSAPE
ncbi:cytochrome P450 2H2-like [Tetranychus urticae]|uniref:cytochrome P450 2H2-like n=1 Tax=Tetranychus urticae TaxID=32264 RepID=UPI000D64D52B|nr:cytochrome P450 2H2-like [Tetranychus urticae]